MARLKLGIFNHEISQIGRRYRSLLTIPSRAPNRLGVPLNASEASRFTSYSGFLVKLSSKYPQKLLLDLCLGHFHIGFDGLWMDSCLVAGAARTGIQTA